MKKNTLIIAGLMGVALMFAGCGGDKKVEERVAEIQKSDVQKTDVQKTEETKQALKEDQKQSPQGESLYAKKCVACHGEKAEGKANYPKLVGQSKEELVKKLNGYIDGSFGGAQKVIMAGQAKQLAESEREAIVDYIVGIK